MIRIQSGNLLDAAEPLLCHQVNCRNRMGSGVARALAARWPAVKQAYHEFCANQTPGALLGHVQVVYAQDGKYVANIFGQLDYGYDGRQYTDYQALDHAFSLLSRMTDCPLAFPYGFGCGLGGGDWDTVYRLIETYFSNRDVTIYRLEASK